MKNKRTIENLLKETVSLVLIFILIIALIHLFLKHKRIEQNLPNIEDLHQQQEMIDYHRSQEQEIVC